jgi:hypothetical protein
MRKQRGLRIAKVKDHYNPVLLKIAACDDLMPPRFACGLVENDLAITLWLRTNFVGVGRRVNVIND